MRTPCVVLTRYFTTPWFDSHLFLHFDTFFRLTQNNVPILVFTRLHVTPVTTVTTVRITKITTSWPKCDHTTSVLGTGTFLRLAVCRSTHTCACTCTTAMKAGHVALSDVGGEKEPREKPSDAENLTGCQARLCQLTPQSPCVTAQNSYFFSHELATLQ